MCNRGRNIVIALLTFIMLASLSVLIFKFVINNISSLVSDNVSDSHDIGGVDKLESSVEKKEFKKASTENNLPEKKEFKEIVKEAEQGKQVEKNSFSRTEKAMDIEGFWNAAGRDDGIKSTWEFNSGELIVNGKYRHSYHVSNRVDKNGYTVVTISNSRGHHALLLKETSYGMEGLTAEALDYEKYLKYEEAPVNNQVIEFYGETNSRYQREPDTLQAKDGKYENNIKSSRNAIYYRVITGAYRDRDNAEKEKKELADAGYEVAIIEPNMEYSVSGAETLYSVMCGSYTTQWEAENKSYELQRKGFDAVIVEYRP